MKRLFNILMLLIALTSCTTANVQATPTPQPTQTNPQPVPEWISDTENSVGYPVTLVDPQDDTRTFKVFQNDPEGEIQCIASWADDCQFALGMAIVIESEGDTRTCVPGIELRDTLIYKTEIWTLKSVP